METILAVNLAETGKLLRIRHWIKNGFVLAPLLFAGKALLLPELARGLQAAFAFSLAASAVYVLNDWCDRAQDRFHPTKKVRPLATGSLGDRQAFLLGAGCLAGALLLGVGINRGFVLVMTGYMAINIGYSVYFRNVFLLDVAVIAAGFLLRVLAGSVAIQVPLSQWMALTTLCIALFLGLGKRYGEVEGAKSAVTHCTAGRGSLGRYGQHDLKTLLAVTGVMTMTVYCLYAWYGTHGHRGWMLASCFLVGLGLHRYYRLLVKNEQEGDPVELLYKDPGIQMTVFLYITMMSVVFAL